MNDDFILRFYFTYTANDNLNYKNKIKILSNKCSFIYLTISFSKYIICKSIKCFGKVISKVKIHYEINKLKIICHFKININSANIILGGGQRKLKQYKSVVRSKGA